VSRQNVVGGNDLKVGPTECIIQPRGRGPPLKNNPNFFKKLGMSFRGGPLPWVLAKRNHPKRKSLRRRGSFDRIAGGDSTHETIHGMLRVSNSSIGQQQMRPRLTHCDTNRKCTLVRSSWYKSNKKGVPGLNPHIEEASLAV